jgi:hypothetical protein
MRTILEDSRIDKRYWHEIAKASSLTLNQIPTHRSKKSPFELFKNRTLPINYFYPIGNRVSYLLQSKPFSKLKPKGELGVLIGYTDELRSYRILSDGGKIVETKNVQFLDYTPPLNKTNDWDIQVEDEQDPSALEDSSSLTGLSEEADTGSNESEESNNDTVAASLIPEPPTEQRVLRDRTQAVKPAKYTYLTTDPTSFKSAMASTEKDKWQRAAEEELSSIESHEVWEDMFDTPKSFLRTVWTFKTKPATLSTTERKKARLCIQGFSQIEGIDYGETFAPTGKFTTLLMLLMYAIDKALPLRQFDVKSAFLYRH